MLIRITKSDLFTKDPDQRFSDIYGLPRGFWNLILNRAKYLEYSTDELCELYEIKTKKKIHPQSMKRWIWRTEVYNKTFPLIEKGTETVTSEFFGDLEDEVIRELTKHIKSGETKDSRIIL